MILDFTGVTWMMVVLGIGISLWSGWWIATLLYRLLGFSWKAVDVITTLHDRLIVMRALNRIR